MSGSSSCGWTWIFFFWGGGRYRVLSSSCPDWERLVVIDGPRGDGDNYDKD